MLNQAALKPFGVAQEEMYHPALRQRLMRCLDISKLVNTWLSMKDSLYLPALSKLTSLSDSAMVEIKKV